MSVELIISLTKNNDYFFNADPLTVCCGQVGVPNKHIYVQVPTEAALAEFELITNCPPKDPAKFTLKLLGIFFTEHVLSISNCTKAEGRLILDQNILLGMKCKLVHYALLINSTDHVNFKYPVTPKEETQRWQSIVIKNLNTKCRAARRKLLKANNKLRISRLIIKAVLTNNNNHSLLEKKINWSVKI